MKIKENFILQTVADSNVVVPVGEASAVLNGVIVLNDSGAILWNLLLEQADSKGLAGKLMEEYGISAEKASHDVEVFLDTLRKIGCLEE